MVGKIQVNLILLMSAISIVISCLVTNCPRGGKRGKADFGLSSNDETSSGLKCELCSLQKKNCLGASCNSKVYCGTEGHCITPDFCCFKRNCELQKSYECDISSRELKEFQRSSVLLTKILKYNL